MTLHPGKFVLLLALLIAPPALGAALAGVQFPDRVEVAQKSLTLNGLGIRTATILSVKVYVAGLYLEKRSSDAKRILASAEPKRLALQFLRNVDRDEIESAWIEGLKKNVKDTRPFEARMKQLTSRIPDLKKGDRVTFDFVPGQVEVTLLHGTKATVPGDDFARALLAIWLGPKPPNEDLKAGLLGKPN